MTCCQDRRYARRSRTIDEHGIERVRLRPGQDVTLVDVSAGGALIETERRLLPGSRVDLHLCGAARSVTIRGRVLRCAVASLGATAIAYRGAVEFEHALSWFLARDGNGYLVPTPEMQAHRAERGEVTQVPR